MVVTLYSHTHRAPARPTYELSGSNPILGQAELSAMTHAIVVRQLQ